MAAQTAFLLSIEARRMIEDDPDWSWLGHFGRPKAGEWYVDREAGSLHDDCGDIVARWPGGGESVERGEYRTFVCGGNHVPHRPWDAHLPKRVNVNGRRLTQKSADYQYALMDWQRAEKIAKGDIVFFRVFVVARYMDLKGEVFAVHSGGLWGIESDSEDRYFTEVADEQFSEIAVELSDAGILKEEIAAMVARSKDRSGQWDFHESEHFTDQRDEGVRDDEDPDEVIGEGIVTRWEFLARRVGLQDDTPLLALADKLGDVGDAEGEAAARLLIEITNGEDPNAERDILWLRVGDADNYHEEGVHLSNVAEHLANLGISHIRRGGRFGVVAPGYEGQNYISLFWGNADSDPIRQVSDEEISNINKVLERQVQS